MIKETELKELKSTFQKGTRVELVSMDDPYTKIPVGTKGIVTGVDDIGTIHVEWDTGNHLGIVYGEDKCKVVEKKIFTAEEFRYETASVGDYVTQEVVEDAVNCRPPACMTSRCTQLGEPYSHRKDRNGKWRATYATFSRVSSEIWEYRGHCFCGETEEYRYEEGEKR